MRHVTWDIRRGGRTWAGDEADARWQLTPEKFEMWEGKLFFEDEERLLLLGLLLENVGIDAAIRLGDPDVWRAAIKELSSGPVVRRYVILIEPTETGFSAYSPDLPGCVSTGRTTAEVEVNMRNAVQVHLKEMRAAGLPIPKPTTAASYVEVAT